MMKERKARNIGMKVTPPKAPCIGDKNCPFHGEKVIRGRSLVGKVTGAKAKHSAIIEIERTFPIRKYERYEKRRTKIMVHNPECVNAKEGDTIRVVETRKMSKMKSFVIVEKR
jgi:small subunit ribosomal protein S17